MVAGIGLEYRMSVSVVGLPQASRLALVLAYIDVHLAEPVTLRELARVAQLSSMHFAKLFRVATGVPPHTYLLRRRIQIAQALLAQANCAVLDTALMVGFRSQAHFSLVFKRFVGVPPWRWQQSTRRDGVARLPAMADRQTKKSPHGAGSCLSGS